jgi:amino acid adenylation domain-containing protein
MLEYRDRSDEEDLDPVTSATSEEVEAVVVEASFAQQRLWFLDRLDPASTSYNLPLVLRLSGELDVMALERALSGLVERHEALRTTFSEHEGEVFQVVRPAEPVSLAFLDLSGEAEAESGALRLATAEVGRRFDLAVGPLFRASLLRLRAAEHLLVLTLHHIVGDGWSMRVVRRDLAELYSAAVADRPAELPELSVQYADFAVWQREWLQGERLDQLLSYWRERLASAPERLELPTDRPAPAVQSYRGDHRRRLLSPALAQQLKERAFEADSSLFMVLLAGFSALLARYSGTEDLVVAAPVANRTQAELEELVGFFVNTLALRIDLDGDPSFSELLARVRRTSLEAYEHEELPFEQLIAALNPRRQLSHAPLAQVLFSLQPAGGGQATFADLAASNVRLERGTAKLDLSLIMTETDEGLLASFEYATDLFDDATIDRMLGHLETLLEAVVADPELRLSELPLLTESEREQVLVGWNQTVRPFPAESSVHELFEQLAELRPDAVALSGGRKQVSYRELNEQANRLAHHLRGLGVGPEVRVGICLERSADLVVALLATIKAGGAYVPLDPTYPSDRLGFMLEDTGAPVLITDSELQGRLPHFDGSIVRLDTDAAAIAAARADNPGADVRGESLAYIIYTSGSTGKPKGTMIEHRSISRLVLGSDYIEFGRDEVFLQLAPVSFDASTLEIWGALLNGARLAIFPPGRPTPEALASTIRTEGVTTLWLTAALFHHIAAEAPATFSGLKQLLAGGEALSVEHVKAAVVALDGGLFVNGYGPTETTTFACCYPVTRATELGDSLPIGGPIANTETYILDSRRQPVPIGVAGELYIGGPGLARGYLNRPELTEERFVAHPFSDRPGARLYRTGDRVRHRGDGTIEFLGRFDDQVKIRGFRVEPGEVEAALLRNPDVREAAVVARRAPDGNQRLIAYTVAAGPAATTSELRAYLAETLPDYMIPAAFVSLDELPRTPEGKLDRRALPEPSGDRPELEQGYVAPQSPLEEKLAGIYAELLGLGRVGRNDDFFELGGHSLLAVRLFSVIDRKLGVKLPLAVLFEGGSVAELAAAIERERETTAAWSSVVPLKPGTDEPPVFFIHVLNGELLKYRDLLLRLDIDNPIYGLQAVGLDGRTVAHSTVEDMAAAYVEEMRSVQPEGPYRIVGLCFAGVVAFEMARRLTELGEETALVALIDSSPLKAAPVRGSKPRLQIEREKFGRLLRSDRQGQKEWVAHRWQGLKDKVHLKSGRVVYDYCTSKGRALPRRPWNWVFVGNVMAVERSRTLPAPVGITLIRVQDDLDERESSWTQLALGGVDLHPLVAPGLNHNNLTKEPHIDVLADELARVVKAATDTHAAPQAAVLSPD